MQVVNLSQDGQLKTRDSSNLGGHFNWLEILKLRGIGSSRFLYVSGIDEFEASKSLSASSDYVSLELLKEGLVIRFKKQNDYKACTLQYVEIKEISVISQRVRVRYRGRERIVHQADVDVQLNSIGFRLNLFPTYYDAGIDFLNKIPLKKYCKFILLPEIIDESGPDIGWIYNILSRIN